MVRKRLTITLKQDLLELVDKQVDGSKIRNRSHAIEYILAKNLIPEATRVLILAGGAGIKLRPITYEIPKCLIPIHGRPLLEYTFDTLKKYNLSDIIISLGHLGEKIKNYFQDGTRYNLRINYLEIDKVKKGTVYPVIAAKEQVNGKPFIVIYGDVLADIDYLDLLEFHQNHRGVVTMALASVEVPSIWGVVDMQGSRVVKFQEKPKKKVKSHLINAGIYVFDPSIFNYLNEEQSSLENEVFPHLAKEGKINGYPFEGQWFDVGTPETYEKALKEWKVLK